MITLEQAKVLREILGKFNKSEVLEWTSLDESMVHLSELEDGQLANEAEAFMELHTKHQARCASDHPIEECFVPVIVEGIGFILDDYQDTKNHLPKNSRYILEYYISLSHNGAIVWR